jgi:hypothetical protein
MAGAAAGWTGMLDTLFRGVVRFVLILAVVALLTAGLALLLIAVWEVNAERAFPLTFYLAGAFLAIGGFLGMAGGSPQAGALIRDPGHGDFQERLRAQNRALVYGSVGVGLLVIGGLLDTLLS